jgi:hypothetical protein
MSEQSTERRVSFKEDTVSHKNDAILEEDDLSELWYSYEDCMRTEMRNKLAVGMVKMGGPIPAPDQESFRGLESLFHQAIQDKANESKEAVFNAQRQHKSVIDAYAPFSKESSHDARILGLRDEEEARRQYENQNSHRSLPPRKEPPVTGPSTRIRKFLNFFRRKPCNKLRSVMR